MQHLRFIIPVFLVAGNVFKGGAALPNGGEHARLKHEKEVFNAVTPQSLSDIFNFKDGVDITDTLAKILVSLSQDPQNGGIYSPMSDNFLWELIRQKIACDFVSAWIALCNIIDDDRDNRAEGAAVTLEDVIGCTLEDSYGEGIDPELRKTFYDLVPLIREARNGNMVEAKKIVTNLAKHFNDFDQLNNIDQSTKLTILAKVNEKLKGWANNCLKEIE